MPVDQALARKLAAATQTLKDTYALREDLVVEAWKKGGGIRQIAEAAGMTHTAVSNLLERKGARKKWTLSAEDSARAERELRGER